MGPQFVSLSELRGYSLAEGITAQALFGEGAMLNLVELAPGALIPPHSHPHEHLGVVLRGELKLVAADREPGRSAVSRTDEFLGARLSMS